MQIAPTDVISLPNLAGIIATSQPGWMAEALCGQVDPDLFYADKSEMQLTGIAKRVCRNCPVMGECLAYALDTREPFGVWGGKSAAERRDLLRQPRPESRIEHGTNSGYNRHHREGQDPCEPCREASRVYQSERRAAKRKAAA